MRTIFAPFGGCTLNSFLIWNDACFGWTVFEAAPSNAWTETTMAAPASRKAKKKGLPGTSGKFITFIPVGLQRGCTNGATLKRIVATTDRRFRELPSSEAAFAQDEHARSQVREKYISHGAGPVNRVLHTANQRRL